MGTMPVTWAPAAGEAIVTQGGTPQTTWICATADAAPNDAVRVPFAGGGLAVNRTLDPLELFSVPTPPPTVQAKETLGIGLSYTSNAWAEKSCVSNGRRVTSEGVITMWSAGPGETSVPTLSPDAEPNDARIRIVSAFGYVSVASVAVPPEVMMRLVVPRAPPPGVTPSRRRAARATDPVQGVIVAFSASFAVTVTENGAPAAAAAGAVT